MSRGDLVTAIPNFYRLEHSYALSPAHNEMLTESYHIEEGCLILPGKPGLGYELDEKWLAAHSVLHE